MGGVRRRMVGGKRGGEGRKRRMSCSEEKTLLMSEVVLV